MKPRILPLLSVLVFAALTALPLSAADKSAAEPAAEKDGKKNVTTIVLAAKTDAAHTAVLQALAGVGAEIKKDTATAIEAKRPNKVGLALGSGGEKLFVELKDAGDGKTEVKVTTKKTLLGIAGQKLWNEEVAKQIEAALK